MDNRLPRPDRKTDYSKKTDPRDRSRDWTEKPERFRRSEQIRPDFDVEEEEEPPTMRPEMDRGT